MANIYGEKLMQITEKIGLIIPFFNRPHYLSALLLSLKSSYLPENMTVMLMNDGSDEPYAWKLFKGLKEDYLGTTPIIKVIHESPRHIWNCLREGFDFFIENNYDVLMNLNADMIVKPEWITRLIDLHRRFPYTIVTGFNTIDNHPVLENHNDYRVKETCEGLIWYLIKIYIRNL